MTTVVKYNAKKRTYTGTNENDVLNASLLRYEPIGKTNIKKNRGLTITGGNGDDEITGTDYNDTIKGGNGNDTITGGLGVDTITGGAGKNVINYSKGDGNDIINLTKGENFTLNFTDLSKDDLRFEFTNKNKDLRIYTLKTSDDEYITIKNFVKKDVTNNSNTKKGISDTSSVELMFNNAESSRINLRTATDLYKAEITKNYTGTWLSETISAEDYVILKKGEIVEDYTKKGLTIKTGGGSNTVTGSDYSDTIIGGNGGNVITGGYGNDKLTGGKGNNTFIFNSGDGADTITDAKFGDTIKIEDVDADDLKYIKNGNDLEIYYDENYDSNNKIIVKNYFKNYSVDKLITQDKEISLRDIEYQTAGKGKIEGTTKDDILIGSIFADTIRGYAGDDAILGGKGNDKLYGGTGINTFVFNYNDGIDTIYYEGGTDIIDLSNIKIDDLNIYYLNYYNYEPSLLVHKSGNDAVITYYWNGYKANDKIILKDYLLSNGDSDIKVKFDINGEEKIYNFKDIAYTEMGDWRTKKQTIYGTFLPDTIECGQGTTTIYSGGNENSIDIPYNCGSVKIYGSDNGEDKLCFEDCAVADLIFKKSGNNLIISGYYKNNKITVIDFYSGNSSVKTISDGGNTYNISDLIGFDKTYSTNISSTIHLKNNDGNVGIFGSPTLIFDNVEKLQDLVLEKKSHNTVIKYNDGKDSVTVFSSPKIQFGNEFYAIGEGPFVSKGQDTYLLSNANNFGTYGYYGNIYGNDKNNVLISCKEILYGNGGNDILISCEEDLYGGDGNDLLYGHYGYGNMFRDINFDFNFDSTLIWDYDISSRPQKLCGGSGSDKYFIFIETNWQYSHYVNTNDFYIYDECGYDELYINCDVSRLNILVNVKNDGTYEDMLYLNNFLKKTVFKNGLEIDKYFSEGCIEKIVATDDYTGAGSDNPEYFLDMSNFDTVRAEVAAWLQANDYSDVITAINENNDNLQTLISADYFGALEWKEIQ